MNEDPNGPMAVSSTHGQSALSAQNLEEMAIGWAYDARKVSDIWLNLRDYWQSVAAAWRQVDRAVVWRDKEQERIWRSQALYTTEFAIALEKNLRKRQPEALPKAAKAAENLTEKNAIAAETEDAAQEAWRAWQADGGDPWPVAAAMSAAHVAAHVAAEAKRELEWAEGGGQFGSKEDLWHAINYSARDLRRAALKWVIVHPAGGQETEELETLKAAWLLAAAAAKAAVAALEAEEAKDST